MTRRPRLGWVLIVVGLCLFAVNIARADEPEFTASTMKEAAHMTVKQYLGPIVQPDSRLPWVHLKPCFDVGERGRWWRCEFVSRGATTCRGHVHVLSAPKEWVTWVPRLECAPS